MTIFQSPFLQTRFSPSRNTVNSPKLTPYLPETTSFLPTSSTTTINSENLPVGLLACLPAWLIGF